MVMIQALNGAGDTKTPTWINFFGFWLFQIPLAYLLVKVFKLGVVGAFIAIPVAESALAIACLLYTSPSPRDRTRSRMPSSA